MLCSLDLLQKVRSKQGRKKKDRKGAGEKKKRITVFVRKRGRIYFFLLLDTCD